MSFLRGIPGVKGPLRQSRQASSPRKTGSGVLGRRGFPPCGFGWDGALIPRESPVSSNASVTVCFATNPKQDSIQEQRTVQARITEVENGSFLVAPVEGASELSSSDLFRVPITNMPPSPEPRVGDVIEITYDGSILESYPAQFGTIYSMRVVSQDGRLTLDDVVMLSQKGDALNWSDFERYQGREVGSGL